MTTYPLSEAATIYGSKNRNAGQNDVIGQGTLEECAQLLEGFSPDKRASVHIEIDDLDLHFGPAEIADLLAFLRNEDPGLSDQDIAALPDPDR